MGEKRPAETRRLFGSPPVSARSLLKPLMNWSCCCCSPVSVYIVYSLSNVPQTQLLFPRSEPGCGCPASRPSVYFASLYRSHFISRNNRATGCFRTSDRTHTHVYIYGPALFRCFRRIHRPAFSSPEYNRQTVTTGTQQSPLICMSRVWLLLLLADVLDIQRLPCTAQHGCCWTIFFSFLVLYPVLEYISTISIQNSTAVPPLRPVYNHANQGLKTSPNPLQPSSQFEALPVHQLCIYIGLYVCVWTR
jgi:hypothetical protein